MDLKYYQDILEGKNNDAETQKHPSDIASQKNKAKKNIERI